MMMMMIVLKYLNFATFSKDVWYPTTHYHLVLPGDVGAHNSLFALLAPKRLKRDNGEQFYSGRLRLELRTT
jgi:hypothetical protein